MAGATPGALRGDRTSYRGVDQAADAGSVALGPGAAICTARSRGHLRKKLRRPDPRYGPAGSAYCAALAKSECLDHVRVWNQRSLRRTLQSYFAYYHRSRTHFAL